MVPGDAQAAWRRGWLSGGGASSCRRYQPSGSALSAATIFGKQYLADHGMPAEALLLEDQGATPWESLQHVAPLARTNRIGTVLIVSEPSHMLRALKMARDLDLQKILDHARQQHHPQQDEAELCRLHGRIDQLAASDHGAGHDNPRADGSQRTEQPAATAARGLVR